MLSAALNGELSAERSAPDNVQFGPRGDVESRTGLSAQGQNLSGSVGGDALAPHKVSRRDRPARWDNVDLQGQGPAGLVPGGKVGQPTSNCSSSFILLGACKGCGSREG